jgi:hypothetical protein
MSSGRHSVCVCFYSVCILSVCIEFCVCVGSHALTPLPLTHEIPWLEDGARDSSYSPGPRGFKRVAKEKDLQEGDRSVIPIHVFASTVPQAVFAFLSTRECGQLAEGARRKRKQI